MNCRSFSQMLPSLPHALGHFGIIRMLDVLRLIPKNHHVSENYERGINRHVVFFDGGY